MRSARTYQLVTPRGTLFLTPQEGRRLVSAAMTQLAQLKADKGLTQTEIDLAGAVGTFRLKVPGAL